MRRCFYILTLCALLGACGTSSDLPPREVLKRTARASQELSSARFLLTATPRWEYGAQGGELTFNVNGRLQDGGDQVQFFTGVQGDIRGADGTSTAITGAFEVIVSGPAELYLNVHTLDSQPPYSPLQSEGLTALIGKWLRLSSLPSSSVASSVTPDPRLLRMQSEVVDIVRDRGRENISGQSLYHYDVRLNTDKLAAFLREVPHPERESPNTKMIETLLQFVNSDGELFIDAETFLIHRLVWHIRAPEVPFGAFSLDLLLDLKDHGKAPPILPPSDAIAFPSVSSLPVHMDGLSSGNLFQDVAPPLEEDLIQTATDAES